ncbi:MAG: TadE family protein [Planctomycetota bacterium]
MVSKRRRNQRKGLATVECVMCLPLIILITFGTIDVCSAMFLKESITLAAYEASRVGIPRGGTDALATTRAQQVMDERGIIYESGAVSISPSFETAGTLEHVTVTVTVPCAGNMFLTGDFFRGRVLQASVTLRKEFQNL